MIYSRQDISQPPHIIHRRACVSTFPNAQKKILTIDLLL